MSMIFLSYAAQDRARTRVLAQALESRGWSVWWDRSIPPGKTFDQVIEEALAKASCVVVLWSKHSVTSEWVKTEAAEAARRRILVPALIEDVQPPFEFRRIQAASLAGWNGDQTTEEFHQLLDAIAAKLPEPPVNPPPSPSTPVRPRVAPSDRHGLRLRLTVATALVCVLAVGLWILSRHTLVPSGPLVLGVMEMQARGTTPPWMCEVTRDALNTIFSKVDTVKVFSKEKIDFVREKRGLTEIEAAEELGITKMVKGTLAVAGSRVMMDIRVVDMASGGMLEASEHLQGNTDQLVALQNQAAEKTLARLHIVLSDEQKANLFTQRTDETLDSYKLLNDALGGIDEEEPSPKEPVKPKVGATIHWSWPAPAYAFAASPDESAIQTLLEQYRIAFETKDVGLLARISVEISEAQRDALSRYLQNAEDLTVAISNVDLTIEGDEALATFTRKDAFRDARSGRPMEIEVRVSSVLSRTEGSWKILRLKKPS